MARMKHPKVGKWYKATSDQLFRVVAFDDDDETIEIQHFDGSLEELDHDSWIEMKPEQTSSPEDWTGPFDEMDDEHIKEPHIISEDLSWSDDLEDEL